MKNIFKKIGFLCTALLTLSLGTSVNKVEAAGTYEKATSIAVGDTVVLVCESKKMELGGISTTSTKYGTGTGYSTNPAGKYPLTVTAGSTSGTYAFKDQSNKYLYWSSGNSLNVNGTLNANASWSVNFSDGNAIVKNAKDSKRILQWNASSPRFACYDKDGQTKIQLYKLNNSAESEENPDKTEDVMTLFNDYLESGSYTKDTVLYTTDLTDKEVSECFHAKADTKYRRTVYDSTSISMVTSKDGTSYDRETYSRYENKDNGVYHTGLNGDWWAPSDWKTIENKFVTLNDFAEYDDKNEEKMWKLENEEYVYELTPATATSEDDMTRMAREFVAPMWLAPNSDNYQYAKFNKLTVSEKNNSLIMKLYIDKTENGKVDNEEGLFSQATITLGAKNILALATFEFGDNGSASHNDGNSTAITSYKETNGKYTLELTNLTNVYKDAKDAKGNSCLKLGSSKNIGSFAFTVPSDVKKVIIYVAGRNTKTVKAIVNGISYDVKTCSDNGEYTAIEIDTTVEKEISFKTEKADDIRCMLNTIEFYA